MIERRHTVDVAIVGGGPAGASASIELARAGYRVLILEKSQNRSVLKVGESLPPTAMPLLRKLNALEQVRRDGHLPSYGNNSAWGSSRVQSTDFIKNPFGHGWHLDRHKFDAGLLSSAEQAGVQVFHGPQGVTVLSTQEERWHLCFPCGEVRHEIVTPWVIDCTGRASWLARQEKIKRVRYDRLVAFVSEFCHAEAAVEDLSTSTLIESTRHGWWYTARIPNNNRVVVYHTDADCPTAVSARSQPGFSELLSQTYQIKTILAQGGYEAMRRPRPTLADSSRLARIIDHRWIAAGDAAAAYDPLSSQGIVSALYWGSRAGRSLTAHLQGDLTALPAYQDLLENYYLQYLDQRHQYYCHENRWPTETFWRRRHHVTML